MEARIVNFRMGKHTQYDTQMIIESNGVNTREEALKQVGKKVLFKTQTSKEIVGKVANAHGNTGAMRVIFEKGMPGQSLGKTVIVQ